MIITDQLNRQLNIKDTPKRIISLVPSQTELLVDLGLKDSIVGITKFCVHPNDLRKQKVMVGGTKNIKLQKIIDLKPDIILCNKEENSLEIVKTLKGIAPIHISDIYSLDDAFQLIKMYGSLFNKERNAETIISKIKYERKIFQKSYKYEPSKKVAYFIWKSPWMVAASNTFINAMISEAGFVNVFDSDERYPEIELSNPKLLESEMILLSSEPFPFKQSHIDFLKSQFPKKQILIVDGELFSWYGSRLEKSYKYFVYLKNNTIKNYYEN